LFKNFFANAIAYSMVGVSHAEHKTFCVHNHCVSARIKSSNIVFIRHKLSLSCSICDFIKHNCSFEAIFLALNSPLIKRTQQKMIFWMRMFHEWWL